MVNIQISQIAAWVATVGFVGMSIFQTLLAAGVPLGHMAWGGRYRRLPTNLRFASLVSVAILIMSAVFVLERAHIIQVLGQPTVVAVAVWAIAGMFALSTLGNIMSSAEFISVERTQRLMDELKHVAPEGVFVCAGVSYAVPDVNFHFTERKRLEFVSRHRKGNL